MTAISEHVHGRSIPHAQKSAAKPLASKVVPTLLWVLFTLASAAAIFKLFGMPDWNFRELIRINGFTLMIWATVTFFSALMTTYGRTYLHGFRYEKKFMLLTLGFTLSVSVLIAAENLILLAISWMAMGLFMANLIGVNSKWGEAREARKVSLRHFITSALLLAGGIAIPAWTLQTLSLTTMMANIEELPFTLAAVSVLLIITAGLIQSAIYPFHRWLLSSMTAPTPASGLMHAGFVNGAGILLTLFAPLLIVSNSLTLLFIIGGLCAVVSQFAKLLQVSVKQRLACSTMAQMGFMIMQCGLGFFNAAVAHLILHGFYKAYLFLSAGEGVTHTHPKTPPKIRIKPLQTVFVLINGLVGAYLFSLLTGKGLNADSGIFLTLIVAITVGQVTYNFIKQKDLPALHRTVLPVVLYLAGITVYALAYNGVTVFMEGTPFALAPQELTPAQIIFGAVFLIGFFLMKLGYYRNHPWIYVKLLNTTQPFKNTVLRFKK
ncbi:proton-conducting transporter transmembrane domain-containing protein [Robertkochia sediminum]|uniref:proton-conducting transporter transmembrane domain-containing protein n=1 Tax=Robertkochia sediminum TaxID=2785326 RepID=UPI0019336C8A|nr:proton-conducting transporter membrane subunit [Robertkochia sediminum]MBL7471256.1 pesticidal protein Cry28Aa [Robertkochia sediminum]